jgi:hypothetical protein
MVLQKLQFRLGCIQANPNAEPPIGNTEHAQIPVYTQVPVFKYSLTLSTHVMKLHNVTKTNVKATTTTANRQWNTHPSPPQHQPNCTLSQGRTRAAFSLAIQTTNQDAALQNVRVTLLKAEGTWHSLTSSEFTAFDSSRFSEWSFSNRIYSMKILHVLIVSTIRLTRQIRRTDLISTTLSPRNPKTQHYKLQFLLYCYVSRDRNSSE